MQWEPLTLTNETEESRDECIIHTFSINCYQQWSMDSWMATCRRMTFSCWVFVCLVDWFWVFVSRLVFSTYFFVVSLVYYLSEKESYHWAQACLEPAILLLQPLPPPYWNYKLVLPHPLKSKSYFPQCAKLLSKAEQTYEGHPLRSTPVSRWGLPSSFSDVSSLPTSPSIHLKGPAVSSIFFVCNSTKFIPTIPHWPALCSPHCCLFHGSAHWLLPSPPPTCHSRAIVYFWYQP